MTSMSRTAPPVPAPRPKWSLLRWHVACIPVLQGCLYIEPIWTPPVDTEPEILLPDIEPGDTLDAILQADLELFTVIAHDPEGEPISFFWEVPNGVEFGADEFEDDGITGTTARIPRDPLLDGEDIICTVFDPGGNTARVVWHVEVP